MQTNYKNAILTVQELADIAKSLDFEMNREKITPKDWNDYKKNMKELNADFSNCKLRLITEITQL